MRHEFMDGESFFAYENYRFIGIRSLMTKTTMTRRFYVGAESISKAVENTGRCPVLKTIGEAIDEAKASVESGKNEVRYIVEIVKIVRRASQPVIVEDVV